MLSSLPIVSILTPSDSKEEYLGKCVESVSRHTYQNWEHTIADNYSTDRTPGAARHFQARDPRIKVHDNAGFLGAGSSTSEALIRKNNSRGEKI